MNVRELRAKHPVFRYQSFNIVQIPHELAISFNFLLEPDIAFQPELRIPLAQAVDKASLEPLVFNLGLVEAASYWKAACSPVFRVEAGPLDQDQITWWHDLFINGLGEFFYTNKVDFTQLNFLTIESPDAQGGTPFRSAATARARKPLWMTKQSGPWRHENQGVPTSVRSGDLILVGGGKDSVVTLELTKDLTKRRQVMLLNPTPAMLKVAKLAGFDKPLIIKRTIDPKLLELNRQGYLNGHTPFSAYLAFLSLLIGQIHGFKQIIASNEESASSGNITFHGLEVNHQYSKSFRFEEMFSDYRQKYFSAVPEYFSFLRPLSEIQIAWLFSRLPKYFNVFNSCNVGRGVRWCGQCPKCAFVFLILSPFLPTNQLVKLFGSDLLEKESLSQTFLALVGLNGFKPFDCVGTREESAQAVAATIAKYQKEGRPLPQALLTLKKKLGIQAPIKVKPIFKEIKTHWNTQHFLPEAYTKALLNNL